jgi:hypothetical protein
MPLIFRLLLRASFSDSSHMISRAFITALALLIVSSSATLRAHVGVDEMTQAAKKLVSSLDDAQRSKAQFKFKDNERSNWHFIPKPRNGLPVKEMDQAQRKLAHALLSSGLSGHGYEKATNIMSLETILYDLEGAARKFPRDPELYYFSIFGNPGSKETWGWRVEGHHLSVNYSIVNGELIAGTPSFMGTNPGEVRAGPRKGVRILGEEEELGRKLVKSLTEQQRGKAVFTDSAPKEIITEAKRKVEPLDRVGIASAELDKTQNATLLQLIKSYVERLRPDVAADDIQRIAKAGLDKIYFGWAGGLDRGQPHYYRVQGPTFLLEYDNTQNDANHVHAVWRDFDGDFGEDLLRKHYNEVAHP